MKDAEQLKERYPYLFNVNSPEDLKALPEEALVPYVIKQEVGMSS